MYRRRSGCDRLDSAARRQTHAWRRAGSSNVCRGADCPGSLNVPFDAEKAGAGSLLGALREMKARLAATIAETQSTGQSIALGAGEIAQGNLDLSQRTEQQAASLGETAANTEQITATVKQNARQANGLVGTAKDATEDAPRSRKRLQRASGSKFGCQRARNVL